MAEGHMAPLEADNVHCSFNERYFCGMLSQFGSKFHTWNSSSAWILPEIQTKSITLPSCHIIPFFNFVLQNQKSIPPLEELDVVDNLFFPSRT